MTAQHPNAGRWVISVCPECGRDNFGTGGRGLVYHWRDCDYAKVHHYGGEAVVLVAEATDGS
jgi:hypothetical protein